MGNPRRRPSEAEAAAVNRAWLAVVLFALGVAHNIAHRYAVEDDRGYVYSITGAIFLAVLLMVIAVLARHSAVWLVVALLVGHAAQVAGCNAAFLWEPWPLPPDGDLCSDSMALPLGALGIVAVALLRGSPDGS